MHPNILRFAITFAVISTGLLVALTFANRISGGDEKITRMTILDAPRALVEFQLLDQTGKTFTRQSFAGHWSVIFFGFSHCPDVCPTTLLELAQFKDQLAELPDKQQPRIYMVSVDPQRDTPQHLAQYLQAFDPEFIGITGEDEQIAKLAANLGVAYGRQAEENDEYSMLHTAALFVLNPSGQYVAVTSPPHTSGVLAKEFSTLSRNKTQ